MAVVAYVMCQCEGRKHTGRDLAVFAINSIYPGTLTLAINAEEKALEAESMEWIMLPNGFIY
jgi:hypothetical protein